MNVAERRVGEDMAEQDPLRGYIEDGLQRLKERYPDVHAKLEQARARLTAAVSSEDYQAIGLICRDAIISFANAIFSPDFIAEGEDVPPEDRAMPRIEATLAHFGEMSGSEAQRRLARGVVAYAMRLQHNQDASGAEARRTVLFTSLAILELAAIVETATANLEWVQKYGVHKCPACGSTQLEEDWFVEYDAGWQYLSCTKCVWSSLFG